MVSKFNVQSKILSQQKKIQDYFAKYNKQELTLVQGITENRM